MDRENLRGFWNPKESRYWRPKRTSLERDARRWVRKQVRILQASAEFKDMEASQVYIKVARAVGLESMPANWISRVRAFERFFGADVQVPLPKRSRKQRDRFYETDGWRRLRYRALVINGGKCGACGRTNVELHVDHIKPRSKFPELELEITNLQVLCKDCNLGKGAWDETDWRVSGRRN